MHQAAGQPSTMQIPVVHGREFTERDTLASPRVAVINQALARKYFPTGDAIGKRGGRLCRICRPCGLEVTHRTAMEGASLGKPATTPAQS